MKRNCYGVLCAAAVVFLLAGCGDSAEEADTEQKPGIEEELEEFFLSEDEYGETITIIEEYAEEEAYPGLAQFLAAYYQIPMEEQTETRYYYNYVDLNDDGTNEIFAVVVGDYTERSFGDPAVILAVEEDAFSVLEAFEGIHTPVTVSEQTTNGWHDIVYLEYGLGVEYGYRICRYNPEGGYQTELSEVVDEPEPMGGTQILSNNLIDDMDKGRYLTLAPEEE